nr:MAG TPA: hypothetical protein [Caudoviricetes sp.]
MNFYRLHRLHFLKRTVACNRYATDKSKDRLHP